MGEVEEVGVVWRLRGGRWDCSAPEASGEEERDWAWSERKMQRQTQTDRDQRKAIYALTDSTTPLDNDRLRSSIKGCLDDTTEKNSMFVQRSVKSFSKSL